MLELQSILLHVCLKKVLQKQGQAELRGIVDVWFIRGVVVA
jgi:hypothetical protein